MKPVRLFAFLINLLCPAGGTVLDPFTGSGTTGVAAVQSGRQFIGVELEPEYCEIASARIEWAEGHQSVRHDYEPPEPPPEDQMQMEFPKPVTI